jgi:hypothetical protein
VAADQTEPLTRLAARVGRIPTKNARQASCAVPGNQEGELIMATATVTDNAAMSDELSRATSYLALRDQLKALHRRPSSGNEEAWDAVRREAEPIGSELKSLGYEPREVDRHVITELGLATSTYHLPPSSRGAAPSGSWAGELLEEIIANWFHCYASDERDEFYEYVCDCIDDLQELIADRAYFDARCVINGR